MYPIVDYIIKYLFNCLIIERWDTTQKFIHNHTCTPPIQSRVRGRLSRNNFWSNIIWCTNDSLLFYLLLFSNWSRTVDPVNFILHHVVSTLLLDFFFINHQILHLLSRARDRTCLFHLIKSVSKTNFGKSKISQFNMTLTI